MIRMTKIYSQSSQEKGKKSQSDSEYHTNLLVDHNGGVADRVGWGYEI